MDTHGRRSRIALGPAWYVAFAFLGALVVGTLGLVLDPVSHWAVAQDWLPAEGILRLLERAAAAGPTWLQVLIGAVLGAAAGLLLATRANTVEVSDDEVVVIEGSKRHRFARGQVGHAVLEGRRLSVRDRADVDLVSTTIDGDVAELRTALVAHGWSVRG